MKWKTFTFSHWSAPAELTRPTKVPSSVVKAPPLSPWRVLMKQLNFLIGDHFRQYKWVIYTKKCFFLFLFDKLQVSWPPGRDWLQQQHWKYLTSALSTATRTNGICVENKSVVLNILFASTPWGYSHLVRKYIEWIGSLTKKETLTSRRISVLWYALTSECPHPEKY